MFESCGCAYGIVVVVVRRVVDPVGVAGWTVVVLLSEAAPVPLRYMVDFELLTVPSGLTVFELRSTANEPGVGTCTTGGIGVGIVGLTVVVVF